MKKILLYTFLASIIFWMGSCKTSTYYYNKAEKQMNQGEYEYAIENYQQAIGKGASKKECSYKIGTAYRLSNRIDEAAPFYKAAIDEGTTHETAYLYYGLGLKAQGNYKQAVEVLKNYTKEGRNRKVKRRAAYEYKRINQIDEIPETRYKYKVTEFKDINDEGSDYGPSFLDDKLVFASARGESKMYGATGNGFTDLYTFTFDNAQAKTTGFVKKLDENTINKDYTHEAEATFTPDGTMMVFARGNDGRRKGEQDVQLYSSRLQNDGSWSEPEKLSINDPDAWNGCPSFSKDGNHLYFASNRSRGRGGIDLYVAEYRDGKFLHVRNLGRNINTVGNEMFPHEKDDTTLVFASDGQVGYGGLDLFKAEHDGKHHFEDPVNLGRTINTAHDDFGMIYDTRRKGYFTSNRPGGKGQDDIYRFEEVVEPYYILKAEVRGKNLTTNEVEVLDHAKILLVSGEDTIREDFTDKEGRFSVKIDRDRPYALIAQKDHYFSAVDEFRIDDKELANLEKNEDGDYEIPKVVDLEKIEINKTQNITTFGINDIYYDLNEAVIRKDAAVELDKLVDFMLKNPGISIELGSHTDSRGSNEDNMKLSQRRADSAVAYIIKNGISSDRIEAKGYGESKLINQCTDGVECSEEEHQMNRRTEIAVTNVENTIEQDREEHIKTKMEEELERKRMEELQREMEEEEERRLQEEERQEKEGEGQGDENEGAGEKTDEEYEKYLKMKDKMKELEKKYENTEIKEDK